MVTALSHVLCNRSKSSAAGQVLILGFMWAFHWKSLLAAPPVVAASIFVVLTTLLRFSVIFSFEKIKESTWTRAFSVVLALSALSWGGLIYTTLSAFPQDSALSGLVLFVMAGITSGALYSVGPSRQDFYIYQSGIIGSFAIFLLIHLQSPQHPIARPEIGLISMAYVAFLIQQQKLYSREWSQLAQSRETLSGLLNSMPGGISLIRNGKYTLVNRGVEKLTGLRAAEIHGTEVGAMNPNAPLPQALKNFIGSGLDSKSLEMELSTPEGPKTHLVIFEKILPTKKDIVVASFDIHQLRVAEKEILAQKVKLQESAKMASLGEMSSGLAHEINNPLAIIIAKSQYLRKHPDLSKENLEKGLELIVKTSQRISSIIRGLRTFARDAENDPFELCDLRQTIEETLPFCQERFRQHGIELRTHLPELDVQVECRPTQISQVLLNLLNNAHDAIFNQDHKWIEISLAKYENYVEIRVTDSGNGIPEAVREKIMNPFFTTKEVGKGTGLGLSLSRGIVEAHHGEFFFDHQAKNTQAVIRLPATQPNLKVA